MVEKAFKGVALLHPLLTPIAERNEGNARLANRTGFPIISGAIHGIRPDHTVLGKQSQESDFLKRIMANRNSELAARL